MSMELLIKHGPSLVLSAITIWATVLAGNKHRRAWQVAMLGQLCWLAWILWKHEWGFLPMNAALWVVYARNHWKWTCEQFPQQYHEDQGLYEAHRHCEMVLGWGISIPPMKPIPPDRYQPNGKLASDADDMPPGCT